MPSGQMRVQLMARVASVRTLRAPKLLDAARRVRSAAVARLMRGGGGCSSRGCRADYWCDRWTRRVVRLAARTREARGGRAGYDCGKDGAGTNERLARVAVRVGAVAHAGRL